MIIRNKEMLSAAEETPGYYDIKLLLPVFMLVIIGIIMVYSASSVLALKKFGTDYYFLKKQAMFALAGVIALVSCRHFNYRYYRVLAYPLLIFSIILLIAIHIPGIGYSVKGSARWLRFAGLTIQPSEFARLSLIIYLAYSIDKKREQIKNFYVGFLPHVLVLGILTLLILLQPDFGSVVILCSLTWLMLFVGGVRILYLGSSVLLILPVAYFYMISAGYRAKRWLSFWDPWQYSAD
ncbi:MAG: FtsW/RodA/SpoVE family cell cycle protein, partial [Proteobacteria bacterium]|nr:FtsW/RodA/SpoVE family cell cycle protein [Pseudomonadota bacterium]